MRIPTHKDNPIEIFQQWFAQIKACDVIHYDAVNLATSTTDGLVSSRMVLLKHVDEDGFVFFTNYNSQKAKELDSNPNAAMCFFWKEIDKQVRVTGVVERVSDEISDTYFASRPKQSQIGAWASKQSKKLENKNILIKDIASIGLKHNIQDVPRPDFWGGYRLIPQSIEFWAQGSFRIHDRIKFEKVSSKWHSTYLYP